MANLPINFQLVKDNYTNNKYSNPGDHAMSLKFYACWWLLVSEKTNSLIDSFTAFRKALSINFRSKLLVLNKDCVSFFSVL